MVEALFNIVVKLLKLFGVDDLVPLQARIACIELILVESFFEVSQQDQVILREVVGKHESLVRLEDVSKIQELVCSLSQEVYLILLPF